MMWFREEREKKIMRERGICTLVLLLRGCVTLGKFLPFSSLQFPSVQNKHVGLDETQGTFQSDTFLF